MKITVIMPVYNAGVYLHDSINSLLSQTSNNWELICIDDGSTDNSKEIIESYCKVDNRIKLLSQNNEGPAVARARAIEKVNTEYISILDSDDAYSYNYIELMIERAKETNADSIVPDVEFGYGNSMKLPNMFTQHNLSPTLIIENGVEAFSMTIPWKLHGWQMIRTELAKKYYTLENASYSKFNSDEYITRLLYLKSKKTALCNAVYKYRIDNNSLTRSLSLKKLDYLITLDKLLKLAFNEKLPNYIIVRIFNDYYCTLKLMLSIVNKFKKEERAYAISIINKSYKESYLKNIKYDIYKDEKLSTKIKFMISQLGLFIFRL